MVVLAGRNESARLPVAEAFGFARSTDDWRDVVSDPEITVFDNVGPNSLHAEPVIEAAAHGKHLICEKPLGREAQEAHAMWDAAARAGVVHMCAFNYRFVPAVRLAHDMIQAGELGEITHFRGWYLQDWLSDPSNPSSWRMDRTAAGSGALGDLGSHVIDLSRYLVGDVASVSGRLWTSTQRKSEHSVDDSVSSLVNFAHGASGLIEASAWRPAVGTVCDWRSTAPRGLSPSTSSVSMS